MRCDCGERASFDPFDQRQPKGRTPLMSTEPAFTRRR